MLKDFLMLKTVAYAVQLVISRKQCKIDILLPHTIKRQ